MEKKIIFTIIILISSIIVLFDKLFTPLPIQIVLETGQEVTTQTSEYFSLGETILLIVCSFLIGGSVAYLYYNSEKIEVSPDDSASNSTTLLPPAEKNREQIILEKYSPLLRLLKGDEQKLISLLIESQGQMLQNRLVLQLNLSKVKVARLLASLQQKNLITKERHGLTNSIRLTI